MTEFVFIVCNGVVKPNIDFHTVHDYAVTRFFMPNDLDVFGRCSSSIWIMLIDSYDIDDDNEA